METTLPNYNTHGRPRVHVIGDAMQDIWQDVTPKGFCQEAAAVPRWAAGPTRECPGGAGNVVENCLALGAYVTHDLTPPAFQCRKLRMVDSSDGFALVTRLDIDMAPCPSVRPSLAPQPLDSLVIVDYAKGFLRDLSEVWISDQISNIVIDVRDPAKYLPFVDSRWVATPNSVEFYKDYEVYGEFLKRGARLVVTRGAAGANVLTHGTKYRVKPWYFGAPVVSVCGAGDVITAAVAVGLAQGQPMTKAAEDAVALACGAVRRPYTCVANLEDLA